jgi:hypothetical protein
LLEYRSARQEELWGRLNWCEIGQDVSLGSSSTSAWRAFTWITRAGIGACDRWCLEPSLGIPKLRRRQSERELSVVGRGGRIGEVMTDTISAMATARRRP